MNSFHFTLFPPFSEVPADLSARDGEYPFTKEKDPAGVTKKVIMNRSRPLHYGSVQTKKGSKCG